MSLPATEDAIYTFQTFDPEGDPLGQRGLASADSSHVPRYVRKGLEAQHVVSIEVHFVDGTSREFKLIHQETK